MNIKIVPLALFIQLLISSGPVYATLPWNIHEDVSGAGNLDAYIITDGSGTPQADTPYTINSITGTFTTNSGQIQTITGLSDFQGGGANTIEWDGTNSSPIIVTGNGFSFVTDSEDSYNIYQNSTSGTEYAPATTANISFDLFDIHYSQIKIKDIPFEFNPLQGVALGLPLFIGLRILKKRVKHKSNKASKRRGDLDI